VGVSYSSTNFVQSAMFMALSQDGSSPHAKKVMASASGALHKKTPDVATGGWVVLVGAWPCD